MTERYAHIACFVNDSAASATALQHAVRLRDQLGAERLSVVHFVPPPAAYFGVYYEPATPGPGTPEWLAALAAGAPASELVVIDDYNEYPPAAAVHWALEWQADLLVLATHRGVFRRMALGSFAQYVAYHASCPVVLVPAQVPD